MYVFLGGSQNTWREPTKTQGEHPETCFPWIKSRAFLLWGDLIIINMSFPKGRNYKQQQQFKKYTSRLFVLIPRVHTEFSLSIDVFGHNLFPTSIHPTVNKLYHQSITTTKNREFDIADTHHCVLVLKVTQCTKIKSWNSKILGSIKNVCLFFFTF